MKNNKELTPMMELIEELKTIKENNCKTFTEVVFFDGIISLIDAKYLPKQKQVMETIFLDGCSSWDSETEFEKYYNTKYNNQIK